MPKPKRLSSLGLCPENGNDPLINEIIFDSRLVKPGCLFAALKGVSVHGAKFVEAALEAGASAILTDQEGAFNLCLLYTSPSPRDMRRSRMPSSA